MRLLCSWMCRAHCHRIIKLSGTLDQMAPEKELVENVHGVRGTFLDVGKVVQKRIVDTSVPSSTSNNNSTDPTFGAEVEPKIYFIGKLLWSKGLGSLMELLKYAEESAGLKDIRVDMYGGGPDMDAANARAVKLGLDMPFHGPLDHAELAYTHKIFVNPSASEVLCTTSAEALAMGKFVILPSHPSNDFFVQFPNCLSYATKEEFVGNLYYAMTHSPEPLTDVYLHALSWEAATERLIMASCIPRDEDEQLKQVVAANEAAIEVSILHVFFVFFFRFYKRFVDLVFRCFLRFCTRLSLIDFITSYSRRRNTQGTRKSCYCSPIHPASLSSIQD